MVKKENILVFTFAPQKGYGVTKVYDLISANIGKVVNNQFILLKQLKVPENLLRHDSFHIEQVKELENYLNAIWLNKGLMLLDRRGNNLLKEKFSRVLIQAHKEVKNTIKRIVCGTVTQEEFDVWKKQNSEFEMGRIRKRNVEEKGLW